jgi:hypothetical protein
MLQIVVDDKVVHTIEDPKTTPSAGEYIEIPEVTYGIAKMIQVYVNRVLNKYPVPGQTDQRTVIQCECLPA